MATNVDFSVYDDTVSEEFVEVAPADDGAELYESSTSFKKLAHRTTSMAGASSEPSGAQQQEEEEEEEETFTIKTEDVQSAGRPRKTGTVYRKGVKPPGDSGSAPTERLRLDHVYGYRISDTRNNLYYLADGRVVWHTAALVIVYNKESNTTEALEGHTDDITCLALHPNGSIVATGQIGKNPTIRVWDTRNGALLHVLTGHKDGVAAVSFSSDGKSVVSAGMDDDHMVIVHDWEAEREITREKGDRAKIFVVEFNPFTSSKFVSVGVKHIIFWSIKDGKLIRTRGIFGSAAIQTLLDISFTSTGKAYSGGASGDVLEWQGKTCTRTIAAHSGGCYTIKEAKGGFVTGGKDGLVKIWDANFAPLYTFEITALTNAPVGSPVPCIRSAVWDGARKSVLVGTTEAAIYEIADNGSTLSVLHTGHAVGEAWALAAHPSQRLFATASDDATLRVWNADTRRVQQLTVLPQAARSVAYSMDGTLLALGMLDGSFMIVDACDIKTDLGQKKKRNEAIHAIAFSPNDAYLAVGSHDNFVDVYDRHNGFKRLCVCSGNASYITHLDWSKDSSTLMTNSGDYQRLFFSVPDGAQVFITAADMLEDAKTSIANSRWASWTGVLGDNVVGMWPRGSDGTDINTTHVNLKYPLFATGDDFGLIKLFNYPTQEEFQRFFECRGHSAHVTMVRWLSDNETLISLGGGDMTIMQFSLVH